MKILVLTQEDMLGVFTMAEAIQADKDALELYSRGACNVPLRVNLDVPEHGGQSLYMPGYAAAANALGVKIVSVYPGNIEKGLTSVPATMVLVDNETGQVCAIMDGTCLTRIRTGAVSGAATDLLARPDCAKMALFGTGGQAQSQLEAVLTVRPIKEVRVFDISPERAAQFAQAMQEQFGSKFGCTVQPAASADEAVADADVITAVTTAKQPVFDGKLVKRGAHVNGVGSYTPEMQEIDEHIVTTADRVFVDTRDGAFHETGDLMIPVQKGIYSFDRVSGELGEILSGKAPGRESADQITFFKTVGSGVMDVVTARRIYERANEKQIGKIIEF